MVAGAADARLLHEGSRSEQDDGRAGGGADSGLVRREEDLIALRHLDRLALEDVGEVEVTHEHGAGVRLGADGRGLGELRRHEERAAEEHRPPGRGLVGDLRRQGADVRDRDRGAEDAADRLEQVAARGVRRAGEAERHDVRMGDECVGLPPSCASKPEHLEREVRACRVRAGAVRLAPGVAVATGRVAGRHAGVAVEAEDVRAGPVAEKVLVILPQPEGTGERLGDDDLVLRRGVGEELVAELVQPETDKLLGNL